MRDLQKEVQLDVEPQDAPAAALGSETVRVRPVLGQVHAVRAPKATQAIAYERTAVHLPGLRQKVHKRERPQDALEDNQLQAKQHRGRAGAGYCRRLAHLLRVRTRHECR